MYRIMLANLAREYRIEGYQTAVLKGNYFIGGSEDSAYCFFVAADKDALADRLLNCYYARVTNARRARTTVSALNELARAFHLLVLASEARIFASRMLEAAITFETAQREDLYGLKHEGAEASQVWADLMIEGILGAELYDDHLGSIEQTDEDKKFTAGTDWENA